MAPASPLLTTKLYVPPARPNQVPRPCLSARLNQPEPIVQLAAPAGFGKTTANHRPASTPRAGGFNL